MLTGFLVPLNPKIRTFQLDCEYERALVLAVGIAKILCSFKVWLLPDPTDVDSKQTTFVKSAAENLEEMFSAMYKLSWSPPVPKTESGTGD